MIYVYVIVLFTYSNCHSYKCFRNFTRIPNKSLREVVGLNRRYLVPLEHQYQFLYLNVKNKQFVI